MPFDCCHYSTSQPLETQIFGLIYLGTDPVGPENAKKAAFDNKPLTYFEGINGDKNWVGMKFNYPEIISKIRYLGRNDDNFINIGNLYELYYWKDDDWKSLGTKISGYSQQLVYNNVPNDALFLLRNHTEGNEERIFTYDGEKQIWWKFLIFNRHPLANASCKSQSTEKSVTEQMEIRS